MEILKLKLVTEELDVVQGQLKEGTEDLHFRLSYFRKRVKDKDRDKYDMQFFGYKIEDLQKINDEKNNIAVNEEIKNFSKDEQPKEPWLKKIYRKIVVTTHPDKFVNLHIEEVKEKYLKIYRKTINSWNNGEKDQILLCAHESNIPITNLKSLPILELGNKQKNEEIKNIKNLLAYHWYHVEEKDKPDVLENYLKQLGYKFTSEEVKKVAYLARKRKVGTRPKSLKEIRSLN